MKGFVRNRGGVRQPNGSYRGGTWTAYWEEDRGPDGRRSRRSKGGFTTKKAAQDHLHSVLSAKCEGLYVAPSRTTFGTFLTDSWLPAQRQRLRPSSFDDYGRRIQRHILPRLGRVEMQDLDALMLDQLYADLLRHGGPRGRPLAAKTVRNVHVIVRKALRDASRKRLVSRNVALDADPPKVIGLRERELTVWSPEELTAFLTGIAGHRLAPAFNLAASTGMRRGEVLGLRWCDVDLVARTLAIRQTIISVAYQVQLSEPKTAHGRRIISLDPPTARSLLSHRQAMLTTRGPANSEPEALVFSRDDGQPVHPDLFSQIFDRKVKALGLPRVRLHDLRHTYATLALRAGVDSKTVSARLGHSTVTFTLDVYTKAVPQLDREAADAVAEIIFGSLDFDPSGSSGGAGKASEVAPGTEIDENP